jgi:hypothetical protein
MYFRNETNVIRTKLVKEFAVHAKKINLDTNQLKKYAVMYLRLNNVFGIDLDRMIIGDAGMEDISTNSIYAVCDGNEVVRDEMSSIMEIVNGVNVQILYPTTYSDSDMKSLMKLFTSNLLFEYTVISRIIKTDSVITPMIHSKSCAGMSGIGTNNTFNTNISNSQSQTFVQKQKNEYEIQWDIIPVITQDMLNILSDTFRVVSICTPLLEDKLVKHIASIPKYAKINYVDKILKTYTCVTMERVM